MILSVVIPAYNEEQGLARIIERCLQIRPRLLAESPVTDLEVIVVSDGSVDRTPQIAQAYEPQVQVIAYSPNRGYGVALKTGFAAARGELVSFLDADGTCDPAYLIAMVNKLQAEGADICIGSRMGPDSRMPRLRRLGNLMFRGVINWLGGTHITDAASGMRVLRRDRLRDIYPLPDGMQFTPAMSCRAVLDLHLKIVEVPMAYAERIGRSKLRVVADGFRFAGVIGALAMTYRPLRIFGLAGAALILLALVYGSGLLADYGHTRHISDFMIYRMAGVTAFGVGGVHLLLLGLLAERLTALINRQRRRRSWTHRLLDRAVRPGPMLVVSAMLLAAGLYANRGTLGQYLWTGHISIHWGFVIFGLFTVLMAIQLAGFAVLAYLLGLLESERDERERLREQPAD